MKPNLLQAISAFDSNALRPTQTTVKDMTAWLDLRESPPLAVVDERIGLQTGARPNKKTIQEDVRLTCPPDAMHGRCFGFQNERATWAAPRLMRHSAAEARPGYNSMSKSEYYDDEATLQAKVRHLARLLGQAQRPVIYAGAGLSTAAGISDYASQSQPTSANLKDELKRALDAHQTAGRYRSPLCAQPTLAHRVLAALHRKGHLHRLIQQNHDGLPCAASRPRRPWPWLTLACCERPGRRRGSRRRRSTRSTAPATPRTTPWSR